MPLVILAVGIVAFFIFHPLDATVNGWLRGLSLAGDVRREWSALQQFGQGVSIAIIAIVIILLEPVRRTRLFDLALALVAVGITVTAMKWLIGRPRPTLNDASTFLFPWNTYPIDAPPPGGPIIHAHAWDLSAPTHAQLWSMPSSHTAFAVVMALFLAVLYPKLRWLVVFLALTVGAGRLVFDAHWLTDVLAGATVAAAVAWPVMTAGLGVRLAAKCRMTKSQMVK